MKQLEKQLKCHVPIVKAKLPKKYGYFIIIIIIILFAFFLY